MNAEPIITTSADGIHVDLRPSYKDGEATIDMGKLRERIEAAHNEMREREAEERLTIPTPRLDAARRGDREPGDLGSIAELIRKAVNRRYLSMDVAAAHLSSLPMIDNEMLPRDAAIIDRNAGRVYLHPQTRHAVWIAYEEDRPTSDPGVQLRASLAWIGERIERRASAAERRMDRMVWEYAARDEARELLSHPCPFSATPHDWDLDPLSLIFECTRCGATVTQEMFVRAAA